MIKNRRFGIVLALLLGVFLLTWLVPLFSRYSYNHINLDQIWSPPSSAHWFGTDNMGRDIFTRLFYGGRISLMIAFWVEVIAFPIGAALGYLSGTRKGIFLSALNRLMDVLFSFPTIILALILAGIIGIGLFSIIISIVLAEIPIFFRYTRTLVLKIKNERFMETLVVMHINKWWIFSRHILPHILPPLLPKIIFNFATTIIFESTLSFIGLGIQPPLPSWGNMIRDGIPFIKVYPMLVLSSSLILAMTVLLLFTLSNSFEDQSR